MRGDGGLRAEGRASHREQPEPCLKLGPAQSEFKFTGSFTGIGGRESSPKPRGPSS
jgi:hypothetical protein